MLVSRMVIVRTKLQPISAQVTGVVSGESGFRHPEDDTILPAVYAKLQLNNYRGTILYCEYAEVNVEAAYVSEVIC